MTNTRVGQIGVRKVAEKLRAHLKCENVVTMDYAGPYILIVNSLRVEVKRSRPRGPGRWAVNFHRHGSLNESKVDAYIVCLDGVPGNGKMPVYLVFKSPIKSTTMAFSFSSLLRNHHEAIDAWGLLGIDTENGRGKEHIGMYKRGASE